MPAIVSIVGRAKVGKTTLVENIIPELIRRGHSVATIKHTTHAVEMDIPGKDSWRHIQAGSKATSIISSNSFALIKPLKGDITINNIVSLYGESYDIILVEGFKQSTLPKIEVHRKAIGTILTNIHNIVAIATDEPLETSIKQYPLNDISGLADLIETFQIKLSGYYISIYTNDNLVSLEKLPKDIASRLLSVISPYIVNSKDINNLSIFIRH